MVGVFFGLFTDVDENTLIALKDAIHSEHDDTIRSLDGFVQTAKEEGFDEIANYLEEMVKVEQKLHEKTAEMLLSINGKETSRDKVKEQYEWICVSCRYMHKDYEAPDECPICNLQKKFFKLKVKCQEPATTFVSIH